MSHEMMRPAVVLANFTTEMLEQLDANKVKGGWEGCTAAYLLERMYKHMDAGRSGIEGGASTEYVRREFAHAANYAMMVQDNYVREHTPDGEYKKRNEEGDWIS